MVTILCLLAAVIASASPKPWDYQPTTRDPSYSAWYQVPKPGPGPYPSAGAYERPPPASYDRGYHGFSVPRHGGYNPDSNMMPQMSRKASVNGYYPHHQQTVIPPGSDVHFESAIERYHRLLLKKWITSPPTTKRTPKTATRPPIPTGNKQKLIKVTLPTKTKRTTTTVDTTTPLTTVITTSIPSITRLPTTIRILTSTTSPSTTTVPFAPAPSRLICRHRSNDKHETEYGEKQKAKWNKWNKIRKLKSLGSSRTLSPADEDEILGWIYWVRKS